MTAIWAQSVLPGGTCDFGRSGGISSRGGARDMADGGDIVTVGVASGYSFLGGKEG